METLKNIIRENPYACMLVAFVATVGFGLVKLLAMLQTLQG